MNDISRLQLPVMADAKPRIAEVLSALSFALDLTEGQTPGHSVRSCVIGIRLAQEIGLPLEMQSDLYYALLMKDAGCSTNASKMMQILGADDIAGKHDALSVDWTHIGWESLQYGLTHVKTGRPFLERVRAIFHMAVNRKNDAKILNQMRCDRGASIARRIGLSEAAADAIQSLNEHWNGLGQPRGLRRRQIPMLSRIMNVAQTADVFYGLGGKRNRAGAAKVVESRKGHWFDPDVARAFASLASRDSFWADIENAPAKVAEMEPREDCLNGDEAVIDNICLAFADVIDAKSPFTYRHSTGVAGAAVAIAETLSLSQSEVVMIRRAALLHDIGKLGVSNTILDKPGKLTDDEWLVVREHPYYSYEILRRIGCFSNLSEIAASHHEKLDGSGYFRNLTAEQLSLPARILVVADIYDALAANRPYRDAMPRDVVFQILSNDVPRALDGACVEALKCSTDSASDITAALLRLSSNVETQRVSDQSVDCPYCRIAACA